jgi:hypothetical protein
MPFPQQFEVQKEELTRKKARAAERGAREARRIASLPVTINYARTTRSRTKIDYAEVKRAEFKYIRLLLMLEVFMQTNDIDDDEEDRPSEERRTRADRVRELSDGGDYRSSSIEPEAPKHGRNTRNSRANAVMHEHGYQTRGTTGSDTERQGSGVATDDEQGNEADDSPIVIDDDDDGNEGNYNDEDSGVIHTHDQKRRHSEIDQEEEDGPAHKRLHLD